MEMIYVGESITDELTNGKKYKIEFNCSGGRFETQNDDLGKYHWFGVEFVLENFIHPSHYKPEPAPKPQDLFQVGDVVYHWRYGKGKVTNVDYNDTFPILVRFDGKINELSFTKDGRYDTNEEPSLFFTPYNFKTGGFSQEKPKPEPKKGDYGWFWNRDVSIKIESARFGILNGILEDGTFECKDIGFFKDFSHEAPPHIAKHLKKAQTTTSSKNFI